jgi:diguanylate cyclase (GGDEF)-like protein/PAS domain S-box-containing protein
VGLVSLTAFLLFVVDVAFHVFPDDVAAARAVRKRVSEAAAIQLTALIQKGDFDTVQRTVEGVAARQGEIVSLAVRSEDGTVVARSGNHEEHWKLAPGGTSTLTNVTVPVYAGKHVWGRIEIAYRPIAPRSVTGWLRHPMVILMGCVLAGGFLLYYWYMGRVLEHLDPTAVIPDRVRTALDSLTEGVLILDPQGRIVLANNSFRKLHAAPEKSLLARRASDLSWMRAGLEEAGGEHPWVRALASAETITGVPLTIPQADGAERRAVVNASPIVDGQGVARGCLVTFDDVTDLERANSDLRAALAELEESRRRIEKQNEELKQLAAIDPLSGCMNRRAFQEAAEPILRSALTERGELCALMCDIDKFKSINDTYGHAVGDLVIQQVAKLLKGALRPQDVLCRYGGEEFCILLPGVNVMQAFVMAERIRFKVEAQTGPGVRGLTGLRVTASFGVSSVKLGCADLKGLVEQADEALYASKQNGRNKVTRYDDLVNERAGESLGASDALPVKVPASV